MLVTVLQLFSTVRSPLREEAGEEGQEQMALI